MRRMGVLVVVMVVTSTLAVAWSGREGTVTEPTTAIPDEDNGSAKRHIEATPTRIAGEGDPEVVPTAIAVPLSTKRPAVIAILDGMPVAGLAEFAAANLSLEALREELPAANDSIPAAALHETALRSNRWYPVSGSRIIGRFYGLHQSVEVPPEPPSEHATAVTGRAIGTTTGACPECVAVSVSGYDAAVFAWIAQQDWIDAVSVTIVPLYQNQAGIYTAVNAAVATGKAVFAYNGNDVYSWGDYWAGYRSSDAIKVGMTYPDGAWPFLTIPPGADIAASGYGVPTITNNGTVRIAAGTSFSTPWLAGMYGRFLMQQWERGALEREVVDGVVRNRVVGSVLPTVGWAQDSYLDALDALDVLAPYASAITGNDVANPEVVYSTDPSYWAGYGVLHDDVSDRFVASGPGDWVDPPAPGQGYALNLDMRQRAGPLLELEHELGCRAVPMQPVICADYYLRNDEWYD